MATEPLDFKTLRQAYRDRQRFWDIRHRPAFVTADTPDQIAKLADEYDQRVAQKQATLDTQYDPTE